MLAELVFVGLGLFSIHGARRILNDGHYDFGLRGGKKIRYLRGQHHFSFWFAVAWFTTFGCIFIAVGVFWLGVTIARLGSPSPLR